MFMTIIVLVKLSYYNKLLYKCKDVIPITIKPGIARFYRDLGLELIFHKNSQSKASKTKY